MSTETKKRILYPLLVVLTLWPLVHIGLVFAYDTSSWKLAGWGMYATPQILPDARIRCWAPGDPEPFELRKLPPELQPELQRFLRRRLGLGRLATPARLGRRLLPLG